jgi:hypothetical protein
MKNVRTMSRITTRERAKNSILVNRINTLQSAAHRPKMVRARMYVSERQPSAANTEGRRADHSAIPKNLKERATSPKKRIGLSRRGIKS